MGKLREKGIEAAMKAEMPPDTLFSMPAIDFCGNREFDIEGHSGIIEYTDSLLRISCGEYELRVTGERISVAYFSSEHIRANGIFKTVVFADGNDSKNN